MVKNKLDYKLVNVVLIFFIIYLIYQTRNFWLGVVGVLIEILLPFLIAFTISYALAPLVEKLINHKIQKLLSIFIIIFFFLGTFSFLIYLITPVFIEQISSIFSGIIAFLKEITLNYNIEFNEIQKQLTTIFSDILKKLGTFISDGAIDIIGLSIEIVSKILIILVAAIYFLIDMEKIKFSFKKFLLKKNKKLYYYCATIDNELSHYLSGFIKIIFISFFEYTILYYIIGHPNYLMLGTLAAIGNLIPYFGGIFTNVIASITAFVIGPELFIKTCIVFFIFSIIDGYVINPFVYGKSNKIHPLIIIASVFIGGILMGIIGIIISLPLSIILIATYKFFKKEINQFSRKKLHIKKI